jgi:hypothetical protein
MNTNVIKVLTFCMISPRLLIRKYLLSHLGLQDINQAINEKHQNG